MSATTDIVPATPRRILIILTIARGMLSISTFPLRRSLFAMPRRLLVEVSSFCSGGLYHPAILLASSGDFPSFIALSYTALSTQVASSCAVELLLVDQTVLLVFC